MSRQLIALAFLFVSVKSFAQAGNPYDFSKMADFLPPSPNAAALGKYGGVGINFNTGAPRISIPLFEIAGNKLKSNLSLLYSSSGIKVDEIATRNGMGWLLQAGGVITRSVLGVADEKSSKRYLPPLGISTTRKFFDAIQNIADYSNANHGYDGQPDIFNFSFGAYNGRFVLDSLMNIVLIPYSNLKIEKNFTGTDWNFRITAPDGVKYYFGGADGTETSKRSSTCGKNFDGYIPTAWYLTKIEHPFGERISFIYSNLSFQYDNGRSESSYGLMTPGGEPTGNYSPSGHCFKSGAGAGSCIYSCETPAPKNCINYVTVNSKLLAEINSASARLSFYYTARNDCADKLISEIDFVDKVRNAFISRYYFYYSYYGINQIPYLTQLTKSSADNTTEHIHSFAYYSPGTRPARLSYAQDHWGYFNGKLNTTLLPPPMDNSMGWKFPNCNADRSGDFGSAVTGMLSSITYPTGGKDSIIYEANDGRSGAQNLPMGGVRIKKAITIADRNQSFLVKRYFYSELGTPGTSSGLYTGVAPYQKNFKTRYYCNDFCCAEAPSLSCTQTLGYCDHLGIYSNSLNYLFEFASSPVSYASVIESHGENFENGGIQYKYLTGRDAAGQILLNSDIMGAPYSNFSFLNGLLTETNILKKNAASVTLLKQTINTYRIDNSHAATIPSYVVNRKFDQVGLVTVSPNQPSPGEWEAFDVVQYDMMSKWIYTDTVKEIMYDQDGKNPLRVTSTFYYNPQNLQLARTESYNSKGALVKSLFSYAHSFAGNAVYDSMIARNMVATVIEQKGYTNTVNDRTIQSNYKFSGNLVVPANLKTRTASTLYTEGTFELYDGRGNLLQYTGKDGVTTSYVWGYGQLYTVAKITGASYAAVISKIDTAGLQTIRDDSSLRKKLSVLRAIPGAMVTTYTYKSNVGISSETDPNGVTKFFEYDSYNRLFIVRDHQKNVIKKYCYSYYNRPEECLVYYNKDTSMAFTRGCPAGYTGSVVRDTVRAGTYSSTTSNAAANQLAVNDLLSNGPAKANALGTCTLTCVPANCIGNDKKCINNICESGFKVYTSSILVRSNIYSCTYHYEWTSGAWSANFTETHTGPCAVD